MNKDSFYSEAQLFLNYLNGQMEKTKVVLKDHWTIDHICYRTETSASYEENKQFFLSFSELLIESPVNGRMIATFKLHRPLSFLNREIYLVELPAPKEGKQVKEGFEHIEVVVDEAFSHLRKSYPCHYFNESGLKKAFNKELEMGFDDCAIKFHHLSLESVIHLEKKTKVFKALKESMILEKFKDFSPLVVGTFPLNIHTPQSDLDILLEVSDFSLLLAFQDYSWRKIDVPSGEALVANFELDGVPFEIFAQKIPTHKQVGFLHFQIEERLLRLGGDRFTAAISEKRAEGFKTEPAFAKVLGLEGDPYQEILKLHRYSEAQLKDLINKGRF